MESETTNKNVDFWTATAKWMGFVLLAILCAISITGCNPTTANAAPNEDLYHAIHMAETGGRLGPIIGDNGAALGPLQIHKVYWRDARMPDGSYADCAELSYAKRVVARYMARYATERRLGRPVTAEDIARIHNGGPNGYKKKATLKYWEKVKEYLNG
jgi:hypothetical protein